MAKLQLKKAEPTERIRIDPLNSIATKDSKLFFSGFCLTDNENFAEFFLDKLPNGFLITKQFSFDESNLVFQLGSKPTIILDDKEDVVKIDNFFIDKKFFLYFTNKYSNAGFYWLKSFLKEPIIGIVGVLIGTKLVGLLKLKIQKKD